MFYLINLIYNKISEYDLKLIYIVRKYCIVFYERYKRKKIVLFFRPYYLILKKFYFKNKLIKKLINILTLLIVYLFFLWNFKWIQDLSYYSLIFSIWIIPQIVRWLFTLKFAFNITLYMIYSFFILLELFLIKLFGDPGFYGTIFGFLLGMYFYDLEYFKWYFISYKYVKLWVEHSLNFLEESVYINRLFSENSKYWQNEWYNLNWVLWQYKEKNIRLKEKYLLIFEKFQKTFLHNQNLRKIINQLIKSNKILEKDKKLLQKENDFLRKTLKKVNFQKLSKK